MFYANLTFTRRRCVRDRPNITDPGARASVTQCDVLPYRPALPGLLRRGEVNEPLDAKLQRGGLAPHSHSMVQQDSTLRQKNADAQGFGATRDPSTTPL